MSDLPEIQEARELTPEDHLAGGTDYQNIRHLSGESFENYYHKTAAGVSRDLWDCIFIKGFVAAEAIYKKYISDRLKTGRSLSQCADATGEDYAAMLPISFQQRVGVWVRQCFGDVVRYNREERSQRFLEEALELAQANGLTQQGAIALVQYTYSRPVGAAAQEVGGVMITLAALCDASEIDMVKEGEKELARIMEPAMMAKIQAKQSTKPANSSLPGRTPL